MKSLVLGCVAAWLWWMPVLVNAIEPGKSKPMSSSFSQMIKDGTMRTSLVIRT